MRVDDHRQLSVKFEGKDKFGYVHAFCFSKLFVCVCVLLVFIAFSKEAAWRTRDH